MNKLSALDRVGIAVAAAFCIAIPIIMIEPSGPRLARTLDAPAWSVTPSHELCFEAIPPDQAELMSECLTNADLKLAVRS